MAEGAVLLRGLARPVESDLIAALGDIAEQAPFRHMMTPGGHRMSVAMTNCGSAGWVTDRTGYRYDANDPESGKPWPQMPPSFRELAAQYTPPGSADSSLKSFFDTWVYGTGIPAVKLTYAFRGTKLTGTLVERNVDDEFTTFVPLEVRTKTDRKIYWLAAASDTSTFSIPLKTPPTKVALLGTDWLMTTPK